MGTAFLTSQSGGKKWATGSKNCDPLTETVTVSGLSFRPSFVLVQGVDNYLISVYTRDTAGICRTHAIAANQTTVYFNNIDPTTTDGFRIRIYCNGITYLCGWIAIE